MAWFAATRQARVKKTLTQSHKEWHDIWDEVVFLRAPNNLHFDLQGPRIDTVNSVLQHWVTLAKLIVPWHEVWFMSGSIRCPFGAVQYSSFISG